MKHSKTSAKEYAYPYRYAYRVPQVNLGIPNNATVADLLDFEAEELGNESIRTEALLVLHKCRNFGLLNLPLDRAVWVASYKDWAAMCYGYLPDDTIWDHVTPLTPTQLNFMRKQVIKMAIPKNSIVLSHPDAEEYLVLINE